MVTSEVVYIILIISLHPTISRQERQTNEAYYNRNGRLTMVRKNWMNFIPNSTYLHQLSIPATHDTLAFYGGPFFQTQAMSLYGQLRVGIRGFDVRCRHVRNTFEIHHGPVYQRANFDQVLTGITRFLGNYPSEVVLVRVKEEHVPENNSRTFAETLDFYANKAAYRNYIWKGNWTTTLDTVRGKIVLLRDFPSKDPWGIPWDKMVLQDDYLVPTLFSIGIKWSKVRDLLEKARFNDCSVFFVNFLSGTSPGAYPFSIARRINRYTMEWLIRTQVDNIGIIFIDYPGEGLIRTIIDLNSGLKITNGFDEMTTSPSTTTTPSIGLEFACNDDQARRYLEPGRTYRYKVKHRGTNSCRFWADKKVGSVKLQSGNENLVVNEIGVFRSREGFIDRQQIHMWI